MEAHTIGLSCPSNADASFADIVAHPLWLASVGVAITAAGAPRHFPDIVAQLHESAFLGMDGDLVATEGMQRSRQLAAREVCPHLAIANHAKGIGARRVTARQTATGRHRAAGCRGRMENLLDTVGHDGERRRVAAAKLTGAAGIRDLASIEIEDGKALLDLFDIAHDRLRLPMHATGIDTVAMGKGADGAGHGIEKAGAEGLTRGIDAGNRAQGKHTVAAHREHFFAQRRCRQQHLADDDIGQRTTDQIADLGIGH